MWIWVEDSLNAGRSRRSRRSKMESRNCSFSCVSASSNEAWYLHVSLGVKGKPRDYKRAKYCSPALLCLLSVLPAGYDNSAASWLKALAISFNSKPIFLLSDSRHNTIQNEYESDYENVWQAADVEADEAISWSIYPNYSEQSVHYPQSTVSKGSFNPIKCEVWH